MARVKSVQAYVPSTVYPRSSIGCKNIIVRAGYKPDQIIEMLRQENKVRKYTYFTGWVTRWDNGSLNVDNFWTSNKSSLNRLMEYIFRQTAEHKKINEAFLAEFDSRADLQEIYRLGWEGRYYVYTDDREYKSVESDSRFRLRPTSYSMFDQVVSNCSTARQKVELSRKTPFMEGDLVLLRDTSYGNMDADPMYLPIWKENEYGGKGTPPRDIERIGTVISVTEKLGGYRASRGSKIIKVMWMPSGKLLDVEERHIKFHERPTKKNGMRS